MPDLHELPDLVAPEDLELPAARRRVVWVRNHAFGLAFGVTLVLAAVLFARVVTLEARHAAAVEPIAVASAPVTSDSSAVIVPAAQTDSESASDSEPDSYAPVEREGLPTVVTAEAEARPAPPASTSVSQAASRQAPTRRATKPRRSPRRAAPDRVVQASAIPTRDVQDEAAEAATEEPGTHQGTLTIQVRPWGSVFINDRLIHREVSARFQTHLAPGAYPVKVVHPVLGTWKGIAKVEAGREVAVFVNFNKEQ